MTRGLATLESQGVIEKATAYPTLPRAWRGKDGGEERIMTYKRAGSILLYLERNVTSVSVICKNGH